MKLVKNGVFMKLVIVFLAVLAAVWPAFAAQHSAELRSAIESLAGVRMDTAKIDNAVLAAYDFFRPKLGLAPIELSAHMRFKGFDVSRLVRFADILDKTPTQANRDAARVIVIAARAVNELAAVSFNLSDDVFIAGYAASNGIISMAARFWRVNPAYVADGAVKEKVRKLAFSVTKGFIGLLSSYLPPRVSRFMPVCLWVSGDVCARSLGIASPVSLGVRDASIKTAGRIVMAFTPEIGFYARAQRMIDELGDAALGTRLPPPGVDKIAAVERELSRIKAQAEAIRAIAAKERTAAVVTQTFTELTALLSFADPTKITAGLAAGGGAVAAGVYLHAFYAPMKKYASLTGDMGRILGSLQSKDAPAAQGPDESFAPDPAAVAAMAAKQKKISELIKRYKEASFELAELGDNSSGQKEFFEKLKELERIDYQLGVLSQSK